LGASRGRATVGGEILRNIIACDFAGPIYPVNPKADEVQSLKAYHSLLDIPGPVDLAVLALPRDWVLPSLRDCAEKGVKGAIIITAGFKEVNGEGANLEEEIANLAREAGIRLVGPNCAGVINTDPEIRLNATFMDAVPTPGKVGFLSQSGALGGAILNHAVSLNLGFSSIASVGNQCDISAEDVLEYWADDDDTQVMMMYLESLKDADRFVRCARRVSRHKPIIALKGGRTHCGNRATASHTGALSGADKAIDALFATAGVVRVETSAMLLDTAMLLACQPPPQGRRVAVITNAGGPGILAADACERYGLIVPRLSEATMGQLREFLSPLASVVNPVDMIASATSDDYHRVVKTVLADPQIDALLVIFVPPMIIGPQDVATAVSQAAKDADKPVAVAIMGASDFPVGRRNTDCEGVELPFYRHGETAARALAHGATFGEYAKRLESTAPSAITKPTLKADDVGGWLSPGSVCSLFDEYDIPTPESVLASSVDGAAKNAQNIGYPIVLKLAAPDLTHKTDIGGVLLDQRNDDEVRRGCEALFAKADEAGLRRDDCQIMVQPFISDGVEVVIGVGRDPMVGRMLMFGLGGIHVEIIGDVVFRRHPLTVEEIGEMIEGTRVYELLQGYRGSPAADVGALKQLLAQVNQLVADHPEISEMDLNPVKVMERGCLVVDARIRV
jgi:acetate---CoA ligase (ADP-forming)